MVPMSREQRVVSVRILLLAAIIATGVGTLWWSKWPPQTDAGTLHVSFFDVGQGDAILIESPNGTTVLVDAGPDASVLRELSSRLGFFDRSIDAVLLTHEDRDHVGGMPEVFARYDVGAFIRTENQGASKEADQVDERAAMEGSRIVYARRSMIFDLGDGVALQILFPVTDPTDLESNTSSIVARLVYGESEFLLTGDSPESIEHYLVATNPSLLSSDVLKAGHHGSRTSTSQEFVEAVDPQYAIISAGKDNRYGHPHAEVLRALDAHGVEVLSTAEEGTITFASDGHNLWRE